MYAEISVSDSLLHPMFLLFDYKSMKFDVYVVHLMTESLLKRDIMTRYQLCGSRRTRICVNNSLHS